MVKLKLSRTDKGGWVQPNFTVDRSVTLELEQSGPGFLHVTTALVRLPSGSARCSAPRCARERLSQSSLMMILTLPISTLPRNTTMRAPSQTLGASRRWRPLLQRPMDSLWFAASCVQRHHLSPRQAAQMVDIVWCLRTTGVLGHMVL